MWQVVARELRDWGAAQCGRFAALAGIGTMAGTLLTGPSMRLFGAKGHTVISSTMSAWCSVILGSATSNAMAFGAVGPMALGAGKGMAVSARIVNLGAELGAAGAHARTHACMHARMHARTHARTHASTHAHMHACTHARTHAHTRATHTCRAQTHARTGAELGVPQGQMSAERNTLNAIIKVIAPSLYAALFAYGAARGVLGLPFYVTGTLLLCSSLMALSIPSALWQSSRPRRMPSTAPSDPAAPAQAPPVAQWQVGARVDWLNTAVREEVEVLFAKLDSNRDGQICKGELVAGLPGVDEETADALMAEGDLNKDGAITFDELWAVIQTVRNRGLAAEEGGEGAGGERAPWEPALSLTTENAEISPMLENAVVSAVCVWCACGVPAVCVGRALR